MSSKDRTLMKNIKRTIKKEIKVCKVAYKNKLEEKFGSGDAREVWKGLRQMTGFGLKQQHCVDSSAEFANDLNHFYARFDKHDFTEERDQEIGKVKNSVHERIVITKEEVLKSMRKIKSNKACGPDYIGGKVLNVCSDQLAPVFQQIFQSSLDSHKLPLLWKTSIISPIPKKTPIKQKNDLRPVALTPIIMKCFERVILHHLLPAVQHLEDPLQFAYKRNRSVEDAVLTLLQNIHEHLDKGSSYVRALMVDFSSAFNTIQPHLMIQKLCYMGVNGNIILWINEFLTHRVQVVRIGSIMSPECTTNTGAPQGCVLSPVLFTLYTNDCRSSSSDCLVIKYADDTVILGKLKVSDTEYKSEINKFTLWCQNNFLELNVSKTKELVFDFRKKTQNHLPVLIGGKQVEKVDDYKYLGVFLDTNLNFQKHVLTTLSKCQQRMYFLRKLREFNVTTDVKLFFYKATIESVLNFALLVYFGSTTKKLSTKLGSTRKQAIKIIGETVPSIEERYTNLCVKKVKNIIIDETHPLHSYFVFLRSGVRLMSVKCRTKRYQNTFVPNAVHYYNNQTNDKLSNCTYFM